MFKMILCPSPFKKRQKRSINIGHCWDCGRTFFINPDLQQGRLRCHHPDCY